MKRFFQIGASLTAIILGAAQSAKAEAIALDFGLPTEAPASAAGGKADAARDWTADLALSFEPSSLQPGESSSAPPAAASALPPGPNTRVEQSAHHPIQEAIPARSAPPLVFKQDQRAGSPDLFAGDADSLVARAVGSAEGTRTPEGGYTAAYYGHRDPGNGVWNLGSFSYQHGARSPEEADEKQLRRLKTQAADLKQQAEHKGLTLSLQEELNGIDLANQAPLAALDRGYIDWLDQAHQLHMPEDEGVLWARTRSFLDPDTGKWNAPVWATRSIPFLMIKPDASARSLKRSAYISGVRRNRRWWR